MSCLQSLNDYAFRAIGFGERLLPRTDIGLCEQVVLIGSGFIWNVYMGILAIFFGFWLATVVALGKASPKPWLNTPARTFVFLFRGSPLFIQFFFAYELFVLIPKLGFEWDLGFVILTAETRWLTKAWMGAVLVLFLNTSAYTAEIFYGALKSIPTGEIEAAKAYGMSKGKRFRRIIWPTMLRLAWPSYTNEAIFLFHATTLVFFSSFPAWRQQGDALYYANYFAEKTFNPFIPYPLVALMFIGFTLLLLFVFGKVNLRLNRHVDPSQRKRVWYRPQLIR